MIPGAASGLVAGAGQPPTQDYSALLTALMGGGSLGSMQQGQTVNVQNAPPAPERALLDALSRSRDMQEAGYGYNPNATWGNVLQAILAPIAGRRREKKTEEKIREAMEAQARAARDGKEADFADYVRRQKFDAALEDSRKGEEPPPEWLQRYEYYTGLTPEERANFDAANKRGPQTSIVMEGDQPPGGDSTKAYNKWLERAPETLDEFQNAAAVAQEFLGVTSDMRKIMEGAGTGRWQDIGGLIGEYFPNTDLGELAADRQKFEVAANQALKQSLEKMRGLGQMTEVEFKAATRDMNRFGTTAEANEYILGILEAKANRNIQNYQEAREYIMGDEFQKYGFARFEPAFTRPFTRGGGDEGGGSQPEQGDGPSLEEIEAELARRRKAKQ